MGKGPKQVAANAAAKAAARVNAAVCNHEQPPTADDVSSAEPAIASAALVAADARGESPRDQGHGVVPEYSILGSRTAGPTGRGQLGRPSLTGRPSTSLQIGLKRVARLMVTTEACSSWRMSTMTHPLRLPLRVRHIANAVMTLGVVP